MNQNKAAESVKVQFRDDCLNDFDIGNLEMAFPQPNVIHDIIRRGCQKMPSTFSRDKLNEPFSTSLLQRIMPNGKTVPRDWLIWSPSKNAFFCLPCRLLSNNTQNRSHLCTVDGYSKNKAWKKLHERLPSHEKNKDHIQCYVKWRQLELRIDKEVTIDSALNVQIVNETQKWKEISTRILDTSLF